MLAGNEELAARILNHDDCATSAVSVLSLSIESDSSLEKILFACYEIGRVYLSVVPYFVTGDKSLLIANYTANLPGMLSIGSPPVQKRFETPALEFFSDEFIAIYQLLKNAAEHGTTSVPVSIGIREVDYGGKPMRILEVTDSGLGISRQDFLRLFDPYLPRQRDRRLGLRVVRRIAELRSGWIEVTSAQLGSPAFTYSTSEPERGLRQSERGLQGTSFRVFMQKYL